MSELKIKPNTFYKTRDGKKAFVGFIIPGEHTHPVKGYILYKDEIGAPESWTIKGRYHNDDQTSIDDLVAEWTEEPEQKFKVGDAWENGYGDKLIIDAVGDKYIYAIKTKNNSLSQLNKDGTHINEHTSLIRPWIDKPKSLQAGLIYDYYCYGWEKGSKGQVKIIANINEHLPEPKNLYPFIALFLDKGIIEQYDNQGKAYDGGSVDLILESGRPAEEAGWNM